MYTMRVFYIIKALQITAAAIVIYRLLSVDELCDIRIIESISSCKDTVTLYLPRRTSDQPTGTTNAVSSEQRRPETTDPVLTYKDRSLEEVHDMQLNDRKQKATASTNPKPQSSSSPVPHNDHKTNVHGHDGHTDLKTTVKPTSKPTDAVKSHPTTVMEPSTAASTVASVKKIEPTTVEVVTSESMQNVSTAAGLVNGNDNATQILFEEVTDAEVNGRPITVPVDVARIATSDGPIVLGKLRLKNTVHNCVPLRAADMLGFGNLDLSHAVALRIPIACMIISMLGVAVSVFHAFTNLSRPRRCRSFVENVAQVILWTLCAITLFLIRQDWDSKWEFGTARSFSPLYPAAWHCAELLCYIVVVAYLVECYFYDYTYYKIYFEETLGNYTVVDRPEYGNSIYTSTVEMTEDTAL
ncbi:hypothetical protein TELCIR_11407 [Teladorsagia circumcincta]|uniref:Uncharacterized protein n=1 Tax=Teladorsagia circumcincta TaxID=45464 RepID=A0A2G9U9J6_TELCI|nr:hypothetical protein TELCIR_11407 [Teladorsagia circumcincta]